MIRRLKKWLFALIVIILLIAAGSFLSKKKNTSSVTTLSAKVDEIRQAVQLSTLDITTEEIVKDSINNKGVVLRIKANVFIRFDFENIPMLEKGDTLYIQLPRESIDIYESSRDGYQVLDVWLLSLPNEPVPVPLSSAEENTVKQKARKHIENQMYEKGYVKRARENAVHSLTALFSRFKDHIVIIDYYPDGWRDEELPPFFSTTLWNS